MRDARVDVRISPVAFKAGGIDTGHDIKGKGAGIVDMKLEVVVIPVSDVDRAKEFYGSLGWRLDADRAAGDSFRIVQLTPPGSDCSIQFGTGIPRPSLVRPRTCT
jgi:hypothetical protein